MSRRGLVRETDVGAAARRHFADLGWTVYAEVAGVGLTGRPDLVAVRRPLVLIAECKTRMSLHLLAQAQCHMGSAHYVVVVTPWVREQRVPKAILEHWGIGWIMTSLCERPRWNVEPRLDRCAQTAWAQRLRNEQREWAEPGSAGGGYWTPFAATCTAVREYVQEHPGASTKAVVEGVKHHYRSDPAARSALYQWAKIGKIRGIELREGAWWPVAITVPWAESAP